MSYPTRAEGLVNMVNKSQLATVAYKSGRRLNPVIEIKIGLMSSGHNYCFRYFMPIMYNFIYIFIYEFLNTKKKATTHISERNPWLVLMPFFQTTIWHARLHSMYIMVHETSRKQHTFFYFSTDIKIFSTYYHSCVFRCFENV